MIDSDIGSGFIAKPRFLLTATVVGLVIAGLFAITPWFKPAPTSDVRVRNVSTSALRSVVIGSTTYGDIGVGETSGYKTWGPAYSTSRVEFEIDGKSMRRVPDDHVGDKPLGNGHFTFVLNASDPTSEVDFSVDVVRE